MATYDAPVYDPEGTYQCKICKMQIRHKRCQYHKRHCVKAKPEIAKDFVLCRFNIRHVVPKTQERQHLSICPDRATVEKNLPQKMDDNGRVFHKAKKVDAPVVDDWDSVDHDDEGAVCGYDFTEGAINWRSEPIRPPPQRTTRPVMPTSFPVTMQTTMPLSGGQNRSKRFEEDPMQKENENTNAQLLRRLQIGRGGAGRTQNKDNEPIVGQGRANGCGRGVWTQDKGDEPIVGLVKRRGRGRGVWTEDKGDEPIVGQARANEPSLFHREHASKPISRGRGGRGKSKVPTYEPTPPPPTTLHTSATPVEPTLKDQGATANSQEAKSESVRPVMIDYKLQIIAFDYPSEDSTAPQTRPKLILPTSNDPSETSNGQIFRSQGTSKAKKGIQNGKRKANLGQKETSGEVVTNNGQRETFEGQNVTNSGQSFSDGGSIVNDGRDKDKVEVKNAPTGNFIGNGDASNPSVSSLEKIEDSNKREEAGAFYQEQGDEVRKMTMFGWNDSMLALTLTFNK